MPKITKSGAIRQEKDKTWTIDTKIKVNSEYKHIHKRSFETYKDAKEYLEDIKTQVDKYGIISSNDSFDTLINEYKKMRKLRFNFSTCETDESIYNVYLLPYFSGKRIKDVFKQSVIKEWYENIISNNKYSDNKKSKIITRIKDIIEFAWLHEYIDSQAHQQCMVVIYPISCNKKAKTERVVWTDLEERKFLETIKKENIKDYLYFSILLNTGLRMGEFLGLQGKSFDYKTNKLIINQQVLNKRGSGWLLTETLKTHDSYRTVILPKYLSVMLNEHINNFNIGKEDFLIFMNNKKAPMSRTELRRKLYKYAEMADIRKANPHALRHNQAVKLATICDTTEKVEIAAKRLGHSPSMFMNTYANHTNDAKQEELLSILYDKKA